MQLSVNQKSGVRLRQRGRAKQIEYMRLMQEQNAGNGNLLQDYLETLSRHRWMIIGFALLGCLISIGLGFGTRPVYETRTSLDIRSLNADFLNMKSVAPTGNDNNSENDVNLATQIKLLQSDTLIKDTEARMLAARHPDFIEASDWYSQIGNTLHLGRKSIIPYKAAVEDAAQRLKVKPLGLTRLVEITCESWDPKIATQFCNTVSAAFEDEDLQNRSAEANKVSDWLTKQVADVRTHAEETQAKLEAAVGGDGLMLSQTNTSVGEERLRSLQAELVRAQSERMQREADVNINQHATPGTQTTVRDDSTHRALEAHLSELRSQLASMVPPLTEANPKVIQKRAELAAAQQALSGSEATNDARDNNELLAARHREQLLQLTYNAQLSRVSSDLQRAAKVSLLRSELDSEQHLYQTLLERAKEAGFASALQASTIRVVDPASLPKIPISPRRKLVGIVGLFLGALAGGVLALYRDRTLRIFRAPGDITRFLHTDELGVIPTSQNRSLGQLVSQRKWMVRGKQAQLIPVGRADARSIMCWSERFSQAAEAYRNVTFSILQTQSSRSLRTYVVTSPRASEGKTTVISNLGIALTKAKLRVVLIDADLRKPNLHNTFSIENVQGLRSVLRGDLDPSTADLEELAAPTDISNLFVVSAGEGPEETVDLLHSRNFKSLLKRFEDDFDVALIDSPPILDMVDTRIIARETEGVILVVRADGTSLDEASDAVSLFDRDKVPLVGTILNDFAPERDRYGKYYSSSVRVRGTELPRTGSVA